MSIVIATFKHGNIEIQLSDKGVFSATINGHVLKKQSLKAMQDALNDAARNAFKPFSAIAHWSFGGKDLEFQRVTVENILPPVRGRTSRTKFVVRIGADKHVHYVSNVLPDTPKVIALLKKMKKLYAAREKAMLMYASKIDPLGLEIRRHLIER